MRETTDEPPAIYARGLSKHFGRVAAVAGLDLSVAYGEIFGLIGPDGAGKTTAMRLLAAVMDADRGGEARVLGYDVRRQAGAIHRAIGYMPQKFSLYADLTVAESLAFFANVYRVPGRVARERSSELLRLIHLDEFAGRRAGQLSGGMQKKLALACALVHRPRAVFLDEPTNGVDPISRREFWDVLAALHVQGVTQFITTPYMDEAERCSRVGLMFEGRLISCDRPDALRRLVPGELLAVWTPRVFDAATVVAGLAGVRQTQVQGDILHVFVSNAAEAAPAVAARLAQAGVPVIEIRRAEPRVYEAFISIIRERRQTAPQQAGHQPGGDPGAGSGAAPEPAPEERQ